MAMRMAVPVEWAAASYCTVCIEQLHANCRVVYSLAEVAVDVLGRAKRDSVGRAAIVHADHDT